MADCANCGLLLGDGSLICFRCGQRRTVVDASGPLREPEASRDETMESSLEVDSLYLDNPVKSFIKWAGIGVAGLTGLYVILGGNTGPPDSRIITESPQLAEAPKSAGQEVNRVAFRDQEAISTLADEKEVLQLAEAADSAGPEVDGVANRDRVAVSPPVVVKPNREYSFDEFKEAFALEVRHYAVVNDSRDYELKWLYFTGEVVETRDTTAQDLMGDLAAKYKFPNATTHWATIRVEPQRDILVDWADDSEFQEDLRVGQSIELIAFHKFVRDRVPQMALDYGKVRFLDR